jgi:2-iminobutanoate/2-iminopropanoate deaminase
MSGTPITGNGVAPAIGPYSAAIESGDLLFCSGQLGMDPATGDLRSDVAAQAEQALINLGALLKAGGSDYASVVKTTIFLADMADFAMVNEVYGRFFVAPYPARSTVQVAALPKGGRVEIEAIARRVGYPTGR